MKKKLLILALILSVAIYFGYNYIYQDHRDIETEKAEFSMDATALVTEFSNNSVKAEENYLNKTIEVKGTITELSNNELTINEGVFCTFDTANLNNTFKINDTVTIKGRCIGYDDLLEIVKLDQCSITTKN